MQKIKWAVIGAGGIADRRTIPGIMLDEGSELVAVMDKNDELAKATAVVKNISHMSEISHAR